MLAVDGRRRELLRTLGAGALVATVSACAPMTTRGPAYSRPYSRQPFAAPRISMNHVIRSVVGHRPYRPSGFVVKSEHLDGKHIVHNYGHGGGGISLSWGSSALAVRELAGKPPGQAAVLGSGVMGLTSARLLQDAGWQVTIYTRDIARHTTSNVAAGEWSPFSVFDRSVVSPAFMSQFEWASRVAHHAYTNLTGPDYGVTWMEVYSMSDEPFAPDQEEELLADLFPYYSYLGPGEHPFPTRYVQRLVTMRVEPAILLRRLTQDFHIAGGKYVIRSFGKLDEVLALAEPVVLNCTGLGAAELFGDEELTPAKGQLVFLPPDPAVDFMSFGGGKGMLYMFPRTDVVLLGGTFKLGDYTRNPEPEETERMVTEFQRIYSNFG
ncbi:MAG: FAD-binding oxidoreductase [Gammaproteobacteria bacterium]|nr:FAD-binding oxidoreductase [Gammaproteobacteria bacterium]MDH5308834.1 FAD-binding oxidoreductase [Gammaproteobacteria bacterium]